MKNLVCIPFAYKYKSQSGVNLQSSDKLNIYLKNACVALVSAKKNNETDDVMLATNLSREELPEKYQDVLAKNNVIIKTVPFDTFGFGHDYLWSLAFYKLCVLKNISEMGYDNICYMDTDVFVQGSFRNIWKECQHHILLYDINHGLGTKDYQIICDEFSKFFGGQEHLCTHYGGEFFAASTTRAKQFVTIAEGIYNDMIDRDFVTTKGDEFIVSLAAEQMKQNVKNAGAYIFRFWTGSAFRLVSTCYKYNAITVLHLPTEKQRGMLKIYHSYVAKGKIPNKEKVWKICRMKHRALVDIIVEVINKFFNMLIKYV